MLLRRCAAAAVGLLVAAPALAACGGAAEIEVGDRVAAQEDAPFVTSGRESSLALPIGRLSITLGEPTTSLAAEDTRELEALQAPEGAVFLPISWHLGTSAFGDYVDTDDVPVVDVISDGARYRVRAPADVDAGTEAFYLLVSGSGEDPGLEVDFDGVVQTLDLETGERDPGEAKALYRLKTPKDKPRSCTPGATFGLTVVRSTEFACTVTRATRVPYAGDSWAAPGHDWLVLSVATSMARYDTVADDFRSGALYIPAVVRTSFRLGSLEPATVIEDDGSACPDATGCHAEYHLVFDVPADAPSTLTVEQTYQLVLSSAWGTAKNKRRLKLPVAATARLD